MSPAEVSAVRLRRTLAELTADRDARSSASAAVAACSAVERVTRTLEGEVPVGPDWHRRLLDGAVLAIAEVGPALLGNEAYGAANELLRFRHFLRHAYAVDLDPARVTELVSRIRHDRGALDADLDALERFLESMAEAVERQIEGSDR